MLSDQDKADIRDIVAEELLRQQAALIAGTNGHRLQMLQQLATEMAQAQEPVILHVVGLRDEICELVSALDKLAAPLDDGDEWKGQPE